MMLWLCVLACAACNNASTDTQPAHTTATSADTEDDVHSPTDTRQEDSNQDLSTEADVGTDAPTEIDTSEATDALTDMDTPTDPDAPTEVDIADDIADVIQPLSTDIPADAWTAGTVGPPFPPRVELLPLPGAGEGPPVITSNNPEEFTGPGLLYGIARASQARGGDSYPLSGEMGVYLHHLNRAGRAQYVTILVTNPNLEPITVSAWGSGYNQTETGGLGLGTSPDFTVSRDWLFGDFDTTLAPTTLDSFRPLIVWQKPVNNNAEIDGRFGIQASAPAYVYVVATDTADINDAVNLSLVDAPGDYRVSGTPPPPFGREAGVYAHDTWKGAWSVAVPTAGARVGFMVNTATGAGFAQVQAFSALTHYDQSAAEAVGMYGNVYDLAVTLVHDNADANPRNVRVTFTSLVTADISRYWDGAGEVNGLPIIIQHTPQNPSTTLATVALQPNESQTVRFRAMVPGLTSIPQALYLESY